MDTTIDIDTLEAGRELDALVAERVMGWYGTEVRLDHALPPPPYSTDIAAAWQVVEAMQERLPVQGDYQTVITSSRWPEGIRWDAHFGPTKAGAICFRAETPMLAICRAALKV